MKPLDDLFAHLVPIYAFRDGTNWSEDVNQAIWNSQFSRVVKPLEHFEERLVIGLLALERFDQSVLNGKRLTVFI